MKVSASIYYLTKFKNMKKVSLIFTLLCFTALSSIAQCVDCNAGWYITESASINVDRNHYWVSSSVNQGDNFSGTSQNETDEWSHNITIYLDCATYCGIFFNGEVGVGTWNSFAYAQVYSDDANINTSIFVSTSSPSSEWYKNFYNVFGGSNATYYMSAGTSGGWARINASWG